MSAVVVQLYFQPGVGDHETKHGLVAAIEDGLREGASDFGVAIGDVLIGCSDSEFTDIRPHGALALVDVGYTTLRSDAIELIVNGLVRRLEDDKRATISCKVGVSMNGGRRAWAAS